MWNGLDKGGKTNKTLNFKGERSEDLILDSIYHDDDNGYIFCSYFV